MPATVLKPFLSNGYHSVCLVRHENKSKIREKRYIHRLVAEYFVAGQTAETYTVNHKDFDKLNNDISNLEWLSMGDNTRHSQKAGRMFRENQPSYAKHLVLDREKVIAIKKELRAGVRSCADIAKEFGCSRQNINCIRAGLSWKHI